LKFINCATGQGGRAVNHNLRSSEVKIQVVRSTHPKDGQPIVFVDTPGFDDTSKSDAEILAMIARWLKA
jgi:GTPase Era involved in 16S rRNA processing